ncbi:MAG: hypothetical protein ACRDZR_03595 [Acidimicrobiales bacterium]
MRRSQVLDRLAELLATSELASVNTSMRLPAALHEAAALAVAELGAAPSTTQLTTAALRGALEGVLMHAALEEHYAAHPGTRPTLGDLAVAAAELDGHRLAACPDLLHQAAEELRTRRPGATPDDVVLWAEARSFAPRAKGSAA